MKKIISLLLSLVMLFSITAGLDCSAYAAGWADQAVTIEYDTIYTAEPSKLDAGEHISDMGVSIDRYFDAFKFNVPVKGKVKLNMEAESKYYLPLSYESRIDYLIYDAKNIDEELDVRYSIVTAGFSSARNLYHGEYEWTLPAGTYYLVLQYDYNPYWGFDQEGSCALSVSYNPSIAAPSNLKVSTRNRTSLKLSWTGVSNADGYKLQQKIDGNWITKATTSSRYTTISNLTPGKNYYFRVRAYINVDGKNYYSLGRTLTTCTKPATVTLSGLSRYSSGHKIKATWKKVSGYASGYQIYWSRNSSFSNVVAKTTVSGQSTTSYTGKNFTKGRRYYVKVRAYKTVNGTKYYGSWSNVKSIVCK